MAINLCNSIFGVTLSSSTVSTEGYELSNLLEKDMQQIGGGFMAERFIKPPIDIVFSFPFKIEIKEIFLDPSIGNQVSCGFEILTASSKGGELTEECDFQSIGKSPWNNSHKYGLYHFVNHRYRQRLDFRHHDHSQSHWTCATSKRLSLPLRHRYSQFLIQITHIKVKITRTHGGSIPCLRRLEIRGQPSYVCSRTEVNAFLDKVHTICKQKDDEPSGVSENPPEISEPETPDSSVKSSNSSDEPVIPEEFRDPLTLNLMSLPVILPSGHTVDQTTLDKHTAAEAEWGRPPCDPFTGITFSKTSKPIPNLLLKSRVDKYLLEAGKEFHHLARTTISASHDVRMAGPKAEVRVEPRMPNESHLVQNPGGEAPSRGIGLTPTKSVNLPEKVATPEAKGSFKNSKDGSAVRSWTSEASSTMSHRTTVKRKAEEKKHEDVLRDSLTSALEATLTKLPSFQEVHSRGESKQQKTSEFEIYICANCSVDIEDGYQKHLYQLPCLHICCRLCLVKSESDGGGGKYTCPSCNLKIDSKDISRVHKST